MINRSLTISALIWIAMSATARPAFSCATSDEHNDGPHSAELDWEAFKKQYAAQAEAQGQAQLGLSDAGPGISATYEGIDIFDKHGEMLEE